MIASSTARVAAMSALRTPRTAIGVDLLGERHELALERAAFRREEHIDLLAVVAALAARDVAEPLHRLERREGRRLHHAGLVAQFALGQAIALPEDAQEGPVAERDLVLGKPHLQRADERARRILDQMREPVVRHRLAPVAQDGFGAGAGSSTRPDARARRRGLRARTQHREADFQRRHRPRAVVQRRLAVDDRRVKLVDHFGARERPAAGAGRAARRRSGRSSRRSASGAGRRVRSSR